MEDNPLERLDLYLWAMAGVIALTFVVGYILLPHVDPADEKKITFLKFACGLGFQRYFRGRKDPPLTVNDFPTSGGSPTNNIEDFVVKLRQKWSPESEGPLLNACLRHMVPWWAYTNVFLGMNRALGMFGQTFLTSCVITYLGTESQNIGEIGYKLIALTALQAIAQNVTATVTLQILAISGTDPLNSGLQLTVVRTMHQLTLDCMMCQTNATEAQQMVQEALQVAITWWATPIKSFIVDFFIGCYALLQLYNLYGVWSVMLGVTMSVSLTALGTYCEAKRVDHEQAAHRANMHREGVLNTMLDNFRALKLVNWMKRWAHGLGEQRYVMRNESLKANIWGAIGAAAVKQMETFVVLGVFVISVFIKGEKVNFQKALMTSMYMSTVAGCFGTLAGVRGSFRDMHYRCERLERFLRLAVRGGQQNLTDGPLQAVAASFAWPAPADSSEWKEKPTSLVLTDISLEPTPGELVIVSGSMGCGKTSLLVALLGELILDKGKLQLPIGRIGYQPQVAFLVEGTIRQNILFGVQSADCNEEHLQRALVASQLALDFNDPKNTLNALRENSDVGRKGSHLSGGQRARVALARTIYACLEGVPLALLDDPVASVDNEIVQAAWEDAILFELKDTTRIVVVNSQLLERLAPSADRLVLLHQGKIAFKGTPSQARHDPKLLKEILEGDFSWADTYTAREGALTVDKTKLESNGPTAIQKAAKVTGKKTATNGTANVDENDPESADKLATWLSSCAPMQTFIQGPQPTKVLKASESSGDRPKTTALLDLSIEDWDMLWLRLRQLEKQYGLIDNLGKAPLSTLGIMWKFLLEMSWVLVLTGVMGFVLTYRIPVTYGTVQAWEKGLSGRSDAEFLASLAFQLIGFVCLEVGAPFIDGLGVLRVTANLRDKIDGCLGYLAAPFFWKRKQSGELHIRRVLSMDLTAFGMIGRLPVQLLQTLFSVAVAARHAPILWVVIAMSFCGFYKVNTITDWKNTQIWPLHWEVIAKVFADAHGQYDIIIPMRAMGRERIFDRMLHGGMMCKTYLNYWIFQAEHLVGMLNTIIWSVFSMVSVVIVIRRKQEGASIQDALGFYFLAQSLNGLVSGLCSTYMPFNQQLVTYRDLEAFLCNSDVENDDGAEASQEWPEQGHLKFEDITFRYAPHAEPALQGVSFEVQASEKLGIVGKTGSGKSTLVSLLLRLGPLQGVPPNSGGRVLLDGVDIGNLKLDTLRKVIGVVPQEPTVFQAPLKVNMGTEFTDAEVITALEWCHLDARQITNKETTPEAIWSNVHENISVGQKQLLMAARALVRRPKVLLLDECTAALDRDMADKLLEAINTHSKDATVLSIAHRLRFILKSDRILVLANGEFIALDTLENLLKDEDGYFATNYRLESKNED